MIHFHLPQEPEVDRLDEGIKVYIIIINSNSNKDDNITTTSTTIIITVILINSSSSSSSSSKSNNYLGHLVGAKTNMIWLLDIIDA
jgi:hypothetical protein